MTIEIKIGNSNDLIKTLPDKSIDCCVTSPPYYGLRDYGTNPIIFDGISDCKHKWVDEKRSIGSKEHTGNIHNGIKCNLAVKPVNVKTSFCLDCGAWIGQLGLEPTPELYIKHLLDFFDDVKLKLKDEGNCFVNLADTYWGGGNAQGHTDKTTQFGTVTTLDHGFVSEPVAKGRHPYLKPKCLCCIPSRFAWGMIERGWILRNDLVWYKRNGIPESVTDRWKKSHEYIFFFTKQQRNYFNLDAIRQPLATSTIERISQKNVMNQAGGLKQDTPRGIPISGNASRCNLMVQSLAIKFREKHRDNQSRTTSGLHDGRDPLKVHHPLGKNPGDVIRVSEDYTSDIIDAWKEMHPEDWTLPDDVFDITTKPYRKAHFAVFPIDLVCDPILAGCPEGGCVLDPYAGSGTVGEFCRKNNRNAILFELNPNYKPLIEERTMSNTRFKETYAEK